MPETLTITPYQRHAIMCTGKSCGEQIGLLKFFKQRVLEEDLHQEGKSTRVNRAGCLGVCQQGPIMVVYPEGVWYANLNEEKIERIIQEHIKADQIPTDLAFHIQSSAQEKG